MTAWTKKSPVALAVAAALRAASAVATAQEPPPQEVVVTGSRIARPNLESTVPITTVTGEEFYQTGNTAIGDLLNDLPALRSTYSQQNSSRFLGTTGLNLLDLRGLGIQRTLVLVNGRRHVGADILLNAVSPDTNTFPTDLIERIDVVTGGNSAVYGSDAIAGVVNFVLKKDFTGFQLRAQGGNAEEGDAGDYYASVLAGTNFMDGRGNIAANLEYAKQEPMFASGRTNMIRQGLYIVTDSDPAGTPNGSDGVPDRLFFDDVRSSTFANTGKFMFAPRANSGLAPCGRDKDGRAYSCSFLFQQDGSLVPQTGERIGLAPNGNFNGGNGTNNRERNAFAILPKLERASLNVFGHLTIADTFEPFIEAKYVRTDSLRFGQPAFFQGATMGGDPREQVRLDNPYITDQARATIVGMRQATGFADTPADTRFALQRNFLDLGPRQEDAIRETSRVVLGVGGKFADDWSYEVSVNYGRFEEDTEVLGNLNVQRFLLAMDSARNASGTIVCRSQIDPASAFGLGETLVDPAHIDYANSLLAGDIAACVPMNPFGENLTPAMRSYLLSNTTSKAKITQFVTSAVVSGSSRRWFELPAGPIGIAFGLEHRTEDNFFQAEDLVENELTFYNALPLFDPPKFKVNEVFTEFRVPLLSEKTFANELTFNAAGRYADYKGSTGGVFAHNLGLDWAPFESLRFRVGKARAVRAPNLADLYTALGQNFASQVIDPCSERFIGGGSATRAANCAAAGRPAGYDFVYGSSLEIVSGGNPTLTEETADSLTAGIVFRPTFLPGLSLSADYFDIDIEDVITAPSAQAILDACYDAADLNNQFCGLFVRAGAGGGPRNEQQFRVLEGSLQQITLNYASSTSRGVDLEAGYNHDIGVGQLFSRLIYTRTLRRNDFVNPADPARPDRILSELGDPKHAFNLNTEFRRGAVTLGYELRYLGTMLLNTAEDLFAVGGQPPQNADWADRRGFPSVIYHDIRAAYDFRNALNFYVGVDNLTDKEPPLGFIGTGNGGTVAANSAIYDARGRFYFAGAKYNFGAR